MLPIGVLMTFIVMRWFGVDANIVALSGIAIAIGVMVDVGVVYRKYYPAPGVSGKQGASGKLTSHCHL